MQTAFDFKTLFEALPGRYLILSPCAPFTILAVSDLYLKATLTERSKIVGKGLFDVFPDNPDDHHASGENNLRTSLEFVIREKRENTMAVQRYDVRRPEEEGGGFVEKFWSPVNTPLLDSIGELICIIHRAEDVTDYVQLKAGESKKRKMTEELREQMLRAEAEVLVRAREVQDTNHRLHLLNEELVSRNEERTKLYDQLMQLSQQKTQFFANVSHELRTPLSLILGPIGMLLTADNLSASQQNSLKVIQRNARILLKHVNDLLDISKLEAGKVEIAYSKIDLGDFIRRIAGNFDSLAKERNIRFDVDAGILPVDLDSEKIERVFVNLLSNAFKFTPAGGFISVNAASRGQSVLISVADSGCGIPEEMRGSIFERFFQAEGKSNRKFGGTGLGLAIVKDFVDLHRGTVSVSRSPAGGALFEVELPLTAPGGVEIAATSPGLSDLERTAQQGELDSLSSLTAAPEVAESVSDRPRVLIVEDNFEMRQFICDVLQKDYHTFVAKDGDEGLAVAKAEHPDIILSDVMMPNLSGDEMLGRLRSDKTFDAIPVIMLTARNDDETRVQLLRSGAQDYLSKPFSADEMRARVKNLVNAKRAREEIETARRALEESELELRAANKDLETFNYSVSHDLQSPLRAIDGYSRMLLEDYAEVLDDEGKRLLNETRNGAKRMARLINDLLEFARTGKAAIQPKHVDMKDLSENVLKEVLESVPERRIHGEIGELPPVSADPSLLRQVMLNLIGNAVKYSKERSTILVRVGAKQEDDRIIYFVQDNGIGFDMKFAEKIFGVFQRLHTKNEFEGTGVGLALVERIVSRHGGSVWAEGTPGKGATIYFALPASQNVTA